MWPLSHSFASLFTSSIHPEYVERRCSSDGEWEVRPGTTRLQYPNGWTNFTPCFSREMIQLLNKLYAGGNEDVAKVRVCGGIRVRVSKIIIHAFFSLYVFNLFMRFEQMKLDIAERTRTLEMIGFSLSLFALLISLTIFCNFRWVKVAAACLMTAWIAFLIPFNHSLSETHAEAFAIPAPKYTRIFSWRW